MQIRNQSNLYTGNTNSALRIKQPVFKGLLYVDSRTGMPIDSWFYRDTKTLKSAVTEIKTTFPSGAEIWDFACSNGEETISVKSLLESPKYTVIGYDSSISALKLAKKGIYTVFSSWYDSFLLQKEKNSSEEKFLQEKFYGMMEEIQPPAIERHINNKTAYFNIKKFYHDFQEKYFRVAPQKRKEIDIRKGDINEIKHYRSQNKVGAIFFRNALYQMTGNDLNETLEQRKYFASEVVDNKQEIIESLVNKIHAKLENGGVFVIGDHIKDHLFLADRNLPKNEVILFKDTPFFDSGNSKHISSSDVKLFKESPLKRALEKDGRFIPIGFSKTSLDYGGIKIKVPTVWKKVR